MYVNVYVPLHLQMYIKYTYYENCVQNYLCKSY